MCAGIWLAKADRDRETDRKRWKQSVRESENERKRSEKIKFKTALHSENATERKKTARFPIYPFLLSSDSIDFPIIFLGSAVHQCIVRCTRNCICVLCLISKNWKKDSEKETERGREKTRTYVSIRAIVIAKAFFPVQATFFQLLAVLVILFLPAHCNLFELK